MSFLNKLMFWKKEDNFGSELDSGMSSNFGERKESGFERQKDPFNGNFSEPGMSSGSVLEPDGNNGYYDKFNNHEPQFSEMNNSDSFGPSAIKDQRAFNQNPMNNNRGYREELQEIQPAQNHNNDIILKTIQKDIEIVSTKLDYIRVVNDNINQRLATLERMANENEKTKQNPRKPW